MNLARAGNKYFNDSEPWKSIKSDRDRCAATLNICLQTIRTLAELFSPVIPFSSEKIFKMLNVEPEPWDESGKPGLQEGHQLNKAEIIFPKIEDEIIEKQMQKLNAPEAEKANGEEQITIDEFSRVELKVAEIISAEKLEKSEKLLKLRVRLGEEERQVIAGIAKSYKPEGLLNKKVVMVANLKPAKLMGQESQGMILAVQDEEGNLNVLSVEGKVKNGTRVK